VHAGLRLSGMVCIASRLVALLDRQRHFVSKGFSEDGALSQSPPAMSLVAV
jgi:hypothetical protein